jgi:hypothetical protein
MTTINLFVEKELCDEETQKILELMEAQEKETDRNRYYEIKARIDCALLGYAFVECIPPPENERTAIYCAIHDKNFFKKESGFSTMHYIRIT